MLQCGALSLSDAFHFEGCMFRHDLTAACLIRNLHKLLSERAQDLFHIVRDTKPS